MWVDFELPTDASVAGIHRSGGFQPGSAGPIFINIQSKSESVKAATLVPLEELMRSVRFRNPPYTVANTATFRPTKGVGSAVAASQNGNRLTIL